MKKTAENRYPHSATLFKFCKEALEIRYEGNVKVIDQDVGAILGYDPADCSHWKKGKKNIRSLSTLRSIADHLSIDERLLIEVAGGKVDLDEAVFEYKGYGPFVMPGVHLEGIKKEFFRNPSKWQKDGAVRTFEELFDINRPAVVTVARQILAAGRFEEAPIYLPEVFKLYPNMLLELDESLTEGIRVKIDGAGRSARMTIGYRGPEMRPFVRFLIAKQLFKFLCQSQNEIVAKFEASPPEVLDIQANLFAGLLLIPGNLLRREVEQTDSSFDIVAQLAETFWVSKALLNQRFRDYMEHLN